MFPRHLHVGDSGVQPPYLDGARKLASALNRGADHGGIFLGHDIHDGNMERAFPRGKRRQPQCAHPDRRDRSSFRAGIGAPPYARQLQFPGDIGCKTLVAAYETTPPSGAR